MTRTIEDKSPKPAPLAWQSTKFNGSTLLDLETVTLAIYVEIGGGCIDLDDVSFLFTR